MKPKPTKTSLAVQDDGALMGANTALRDKLLDQAARGGAKWVRANVMYGATRGGKDLTALNALVDAARARGLHVQATLMGDPKYKNPTGGLTYANQDPKLMAQFARRVASAERGRIGRYSIGNEPNYPAFAANAGDPHAAGVSYRNQYRAGRQAIKDADHGAQVMIGELANTPDAVKFMNAVLAGKPLKTDGFALHPYVGKAPGFDINHLAEVQKYLAAQKRAGKLQTAKGRQAPLYLTEYGVQRGDVPEQKRQASLAAAYRKAQGAGARQLLYYQLGATQRDPGDPGTPDVVNYGGDVMPGSPGRAPAPWKWDTQVAPDGNLVGFLRSVQSASTRGAARRRTR